MTPKQPGLFRIKQKRRTLLASAAGTVAWVLVRPAAALADSGDLASAIRAHTGGAPVQPGKVTFDIASLIDNGNSVPITVTVDSPMTADNHVATIAIFNERNPQRDVAKFQLGPRAGRAAVATRIRLATSQKLVAIAKLNDGTYWSHTVDVIVALAACIED